MTEMGSGTDEAWTRVFTILGLVLAAPIILALLNQQGITDEHAQIQCLRLFQDTKELISSLNENFKLLDDIERYLQDWYWGLVYQSSHQEWLDAPPSGRDVRWPM